jgi:hypothetical protein
VHDTEFAMGRVCPIGDCDVHLDPDDVVTRLRPPALVEGLPTCVQHERWLVELSDELIGVAQNKTGEDGPSWNERVKFYDSAIKARRSAIELARRREDWAETDRLELLVKELRARRDPTRQAAQPAAGSVRH